MQCTRVVLLSADSVVFQDYLVIKHISTFVFDYVKEKEKKKSVHLFSISRFLFGLFHPLICFVWFGFFMFYRNPDVRYST